MPDKRLHLDDQEYNTAAGVLYGDPQTPDSLDAKRVWQSGLQDEPLAGEVNESLAKTPDESSDVNYSESDIENRG